MADVSFNFRRPRTPARGVADAARTEVANVERRRGTAVAQVGAAASAAGRTVGPSGRRAVNNRSRAVSGAARTVGRAASAAGGGAPASSPSPRPRRSGNLLDRARRAAGRKTTPPRQPDRPVVRGRAPGSAPASQSSPAPRSAPVPRPAGRSSAAPTTKPAPTVKRKQPGAKPGTPTRKGGTPKKGTLLAKATSSKGSAKYSKADFNRALSRYRRTHKGVSTANARTIASYLAGKGYGSKDKVLSGPKLNANRRRNKLARAARGAGRLTKGQLRGVKLPGGPDQPPKS